GQSILQLFKEASLLASNLCRNFYFKMYNQVAAAFSLHLSNTLSFYSELRSALGALGNFEIVWPFEGRRLNLRAQRGLSHIDGDAAMQVVIVPLKYRMFPDSEENVQITGRSAIGSMLAFPGNAKAIAICDSGRHCYLQAFVDMFITFTAAI